MISTRRAAPPNGTSTFVIRVTYVYIRRPNRRTNSYNESLLIIKRSTCFGLFSPSSGATFCIALQQPDVPAYTKCDIQLQNAAPDDGLKSPKHVKRLMINKDS